VTPEARPIEWFDSHCHLQDEFADRAGDAAAPDIAAGGGAAGPTGGGGADRVRAALERAARAAVTRIVVVGTGAATSQQALDLARAWRDPAPGGLPRLWATAGLHPHEASVGSAEVTALVEAAAASGDGALVAVGECGLDYFYEHSPRAAQRQAFAEQIALAHRLGLALVIHARDAWDDLFDILAAERVPERTILHCFTGGPEELDRCLGAGMYVSFSGIVTFKNAAPVRDAAIRCPLNRLLVETDAPFLAPVPHRGRPNEPALVPLVGETVAALKGIAPGEVAHRSRDAALAAFGI
jgi:TatD DNase family protein